MFIGVPLTLSNGRSQDTSGDRLNPMHKLTAGAAGDLVLSRPETNVLVASSGVISSAFPRRNSSGSAECVGGLAGPLQFGTARRRFVETRETAGEELACHPGQSAERARI